MAKIKKLKRKLWDKYQTLRTKGKMNPKNPFHWMLAYWIVHDNKKNEKKRITELSQTADIDLNKIKARRKGLEGFHFRYPLTSEEVFDKKE